MQILLKEMLFCWGEDIMKVIFNLYFFCNISTFFTFLLSNSEIYEDQIYFWSCTVVR